MLGSLAAVLGLAGLFVASHAGHGPAYYGGLLIFLFAVLFVMHLIRLAPQEAGAPTAMGELGGFVGRMGAYLRPEQARDGGAEIAVRRIGMADLRDALARGIADFRVQPTHLIVLCLIYPLIGLFAWRLTAGYEILPILFPLVSGFSLIGPLAATGLYELSRRREQGLEVSWWHVFSVLRSTSLPALAAMGLIMAVIFVAWLIAAQIIYVSIFGDWIPASIEEFVREIFTTDKGWTLIVVGCGVGLVFAIVVMALSVASLPMLLDRDVGAVRAIRTSVRAVAANPGPMTVWGLIVAAGLVIGAVPVFVGLAVVLPILGHATWHLYRKLVGR